MEHDRCFSSGIMDPLSPGAMLSNKYRVDRLLRESDGVLMYEATDTIHSRLVCIKIVRPEVLTDTLRFERFQVEAWAPNAIDFGSAGGLPYFVAIEWDDAPTNPLLPVPVIPIYLDEPPPAPASTVPRRRSWLWFAMLMVAGLSTAGGWYAGRETSHRALVHHAR